MLPPVLLRTARKAAALEFLLASLGGEDGEAR